MILNYVVPIALQQAVTSVNFILDNIIVSQIGSVAIAALGSSNRFLFIIRFSIVAFSIGNAVISAQLSKSSKKGEIGKTLTVSVVTSVLFSIFLIVTYFTNRSFILTSFSPDEDIVSAAGSYIDIVIFSSFTLSIYLSLITSLRSLGSLFYPMLSSALSLLVNFSLSYILVFGNWGFKSYGLRGAAYSTVISEIVALLFLIVAAYMKQREMFSKEAFRPNLGDFRSYLRISLIILFSHAVWSMQTMIMHNLFGKLGKSELVAYGAIIPIETIILDIFAAFGFSTLIFVGRKLALDKKKAAFSFSLNMLKVGTMVGAVAGLGLAILSSNIASLYSVSYEEAANIAILLRILGIFMAVKLSSSILYNGILRAGGDMTFILLLTVLLAWGLIVPISYIGYHFYNWNIYVIYTVMNASEVVTLTLMVLRFKSKKWMNNLVK